MWCVLYFITPCCGIVMNSWQSLCLMGHHFWHYIERTFVIGHFEKDPSHLSHTDSWVTHEWGNKWNNDGIPGIVRAKKNARPKIWNTAGVIPAVFQVFRIAGTSELRQWNGRSVTKFSALLCSPITRAVMFTLGVEPSAAMRKKVVHPWVTW